MRKSRSVSLENPTMVIEVTEVNLGKKKAYYLSKPKDEGRWMNHYDVKPDHKGRLSVQVMWGRDEPPRPACLEFYCSFALITGVGFSECNKGVERYTLEGPCGGCFFLCTDLTAGSNSAIVENWGHQRKKSKGYHFMLWFNSGKIQSDFDPQIYNDGVIHDSDGGRPKRKAGGRTSPSPR